MILQVTGACWFEYKERSNGGRTKKTSFTMPDKWITNNCKKGHSTYITALTIKIDIAAIKCQTQTLGFAQRKKHQSDYSGHECIPPVQIIQSCLQT